MSVTREYENNQYLAKITDIGQGTPSLKYGKRFNNKIFSDISVAIPDKRDIDNFNKTKKITWEIEGDILDENPTLSKEEKNTLEKEKNELAYRINKLKGDDPTKVPEDYYIFECFSFDWENIERNIIRTSAGLSLINWGLCDLGSREPKPPPEPDPDYKRTVFPDDGNNGNGGAGDDGNNGNGDGNGENRKKWLYWLIGGLLAIILLFMIKNCQPQANVGQINLLDDRFLFNHNGSNDTTNFFSKDLFKETSIPDLDKLWELYAFDQRTNQFNKERSQQSTGDNLFSLYLDELRAERYLIKLKVTDEGNKFKLNQKYDEQIVEVNIPNRTKKAVEIPKQDDGPIRDEDIKDLEEEEKIIEPTNLGLTGDGGEEGGGDGGEEGGGDGGEEGGGDGGEEGGGDGGEEGGGDGGEEGGGDGGEEGGGDGGEEGGGDGGEEGGGDGGEEGGGDKKPGEGPPKKRTVREVDDEYDVPGHPGWIMVITKRKDPPSKKFKDIRIEFKDPDGNIHKRPPTNSKKKKGTKTALHSNPSYFSI